MQPKITFLILTAILAATVSPAAVFIVPTDGKLVDNADAIVIGRIVARHGQFVENGDIVTITEVNVVSVLKGSIDPGVPLLVRDLGGVVGSQAMFVSDGATYLDGEQALIFLEKMPEGWTTWGLALGAFHEVVADDGVSLYVRGMHNSTIFGYTEDMRRHRELPRPAAAFLKYIRARVRGEVPEIPNFGGRDRTPSDVTVHAPNTVPPSSYTQGPYRWDIFDRGGSVTFRESGTQPGYNSTDTSQRALASWTNDPGSNITYLYGGTAANRFVNDGTNAIVYNSSTDVPAGAIAFAKWYGGATHTYKGETFYAITEGDVVVRSGLSVSHAVFDEAVTHELGHTLGLRHSDQGTPASSDAVMNSVVTGRLGVTLGSWDRDAVGTVYEGAAPPACTGVTITGQPQSRTITAGQTTTLSVSATGTGPVNYYWYIGTSGNQAQPIGTGPSISVAPQTTTNYWVLVANACSSVPSSTATVTVTPAPTASPEGRSFAGDFNGDGRRDILLQDSNGDVAIWLMNGLTIVSAAVVGSPGSAWLVGGAGDFNGDGRSDVLLQNTSGDVAIWLMVGLTIGGGAVVASPGPGWRISTFADFNGDTFTDIALQHTSTSDVAVWLMRAFTITAAGVVGTPGTSWRVATSGDLNADGRADLVLQDNASGTVAAWLMNGLTIAVGSGIGSPGTSWRVIVAGDINGDARADLILQNASTGDVAAWLMNGVVITAGAQIASPGSSYRVATAGDANGDGRADLILQNAAANVAQWQLNGFTITTAAVVGAPAPSWRVVGY